MHQINITDDGDEVVFVKILNEDTREPAVVVFDHEGLGWEGMRLAIDAIKTIADALDVPVTDEQEIV